MNMPSGNTTAATTTPRKKRSAAPAGAVIVSAFDGAGSGTGGRAILGQRPIER